MLDTHMEKAMGRFDSEFDQAMQKLTPAQLKARRSGARKLAAAVIFGLERLEDRSLFSVVANPGGPYTVNEGSSIILNGSGSTDTSALCARVRELAAADPHAHVLGGRRLQWPPG